jgi:hypothetical protein
MKTKTRFISVAIAVALLGAGGIFAVDSQKKADPYPSLLAGSEIKGANVKNPQNETIGDIDELLIEPASGHVRFAVVSVGGFLKMGATKVAIPWGTFQITKEGETPKYVLDATKEQLVNAPRVEGKNYDRLYARENAEPVYIYWHAEWVGEP